MQSRRPGSPWLTRSGCPDRLAWLDWRPESLDKPSRVTFLAQSRSTEAPRSPRESILVAPGGAPTLENHAPVYTRTQILTNPTFALGKAPEPLLDSLWTAPGRSGGSVGSPLGALGAPWAALKAFWGTPDELVGAILALLACTWDRPRAPDPSWHRFWEDFRLPRLSSTGCLDRLARRTGSTGCLELTPTGCLDWPRLVASTGLDWLLRPTGSWIA